MHDFELKKLFVDLDRSYLTKQSLFHREDGSAFRELIEAQRKVSRGQIWPWSGYCSRVAGLGEGEGQPFALTLSQKAHSPVPQRIEELDADVL